MSENISRSSIFRSKMKMEASKGKNEESSKKIKPQRSEYFNSARRTHLPQKNSER